MQKKMLIDATHAEETRVVVVEGSRVEEFDYESLSKRQITGNIYLAKVTRVEPSLQAAFVEYGGNRHGFLAFSEIHPDYYQIPVADREALLAEEAEFASKMDDEAEDERPKSRSRRRRGRGSKSEKSGSAAENDAIATYDAAGPDLVDDDTVLETVAADDDTLDDVPPLSAASGERDLEVFDEPEDADEEATAAADADAPAEVSDESVENAPAAEDEPPAEAGSAGSEVKEDIAVRRARPRRYKIQEVIKVRQILLVQVVKEERGNKGAALTTYLSLPGRYCVLMPNTARGGGISRKITNAADRKKLKEIASAITVPKGAGLIIRTAGAQRTKSEVKRDYEYLLRMWEKIRDLTLKSIAPVLIYEEGNLVRRAIRDLYSRDIDEIFVEGERGYREAKDYMKMLMPSHAKNVKQYGDPMPLFSRYQVEGYLAGMFNPVVQLKSGGYIVINPTEALVAVDVNSGRATKEGSIEDTALKTNLEAAEEVARQMRLRDLAGLIVIDFIDMEERRNIAAVEKKLKEKLKNDRARIQLGRISAFGLLEMSRQRLRPGMLEAVTAPCAHCHGTGRTRSDESLALAIMRELEEEGVRGRSKEVLVTAPVAIANYVLNVKRDHVAMIEGRFGMAVRVEGDPALISPEYRVERFRTASRQVQMLAELAKAPALPEDEDDLAEVVEDETDEDVAADSVGDDSERGEKSGRRHRRRRRRRGGRNGEGRDEGQPITAGEEGEGDEGPEDAAEVETAAEAGAEPDQPEATEDTEAEAKPKSRRTRSRRKPRAAEAAEAEAAEAEAEAAGAVEAEPDTADAAPEPAAEKPKPRSRSRARAKAAKPAEEPAEQEAPTAEAAPVQAEEPEAAQATDAAAQPSEPEPAAEPEPAEEEMATARSGPKPRARVSAAEAIASVTAESAAPTAERGESQAPKRRGWWARALGGS